jgi:hypothetical protein
MIKQAYNLDREFIKWFYEEPYPDELNNRAGVMARIPMLSVEQRDYFMRAAFKQGAKSMAGETLCILGDWSAACAGLDPELVAPDEVFECAQENLDAYYKQLELFP